MIFYLTFNDAPSGIYSSQVIDVVTFYRKELNVKIRLVAFISLRGFLNNRQKIQSEMPDAIVLPMFPGVKRWRYNGFLLKILCFIKKPGAIIGRSVLATQLAFKAGAGKVIYDGRGAIEAEWKEYGIITDPTMLSEIRDLERGAVMDSDFRIAVSNELVKLWRKDFNYTGTGHVVIPCTLNIVFEQTDFNESSVLKARQNLGFDKADLVFVYSGSVAGWQSFELLYKFMAPLLRANRSVKLFFLAEADKNILQLRSEFPDQVMYKKVSPKEVPAYLLAADHGLLIREESVTNKVASPVKFAEYLACGLNVIISGNLGDYSEFVQKNNCGSVYPAVELMKPLNFAAKQRSKELAMACFSKMSFRDQYSEIIK